ncbi:MvdC/MvdD family ATP grasp protein [Methylobacterium sp. JK268]
MLLILSRPDDAHVPMVVPKLEARGIPYLWFDPARYPGEAEISIALDGGGVVRRVLHVDGRAHDLSAVTGVWNRRPGEPRAGPAVTDPTHRAFVESVGERFLAGLWDTLDCRWLPATPAVDRRARNKILQLALAARLGFRLPDTLVTNHPEDVLSFIGTHGDGLVSKSLAPFELSLDGEDHVVSYTRPVSRRDAFAVRSVRHAPVIFQGYVRKRVELRVTLVGTHVFAVEIGSQAHRATRHDWRHVSDETVRYSPHALPEPVAERCLRLMRELGLSYGAVDLILTPEGEYVFLEINPNGQWGWIEDLTGLPIAEAVIDHLTGASG